MNASEARLGWEQARLGDIADIVRGVTYAKRDASFTPGQGLVPLLRATNIGVDLSLHELVYVPRRVVSDVQLLRPGDIILAGSSGSRDVVGKAAPLTHEWFGTFGAFCFVVRPHEPMNPAYVACFLASPVYRMQVSALAAGVNINNLRRSHLEEMMVPVPPRAEQDRIVEEVGRRLFSLREAARKVASSKRDLTDLRMAIVRDLFTGEETSSGGDGGRALLVELSENRAAHAPTLKGSKATPPVAPNEEILRLELPDGWGLASLDELTDPSRPICYGILMPKEHVADGVPYVKVKDMRQKAIDTLSLSRTSPEIAAKYARSTLAPGDILVSIRGTYGRVAVVPDELAGGNITQDTARIAPLSGVERDYLATYLGSPLAKRYFDRVARGVAVRGVNISDLRALPVPVPPTAEQHAIAELAQARLLAVDTLEAVLSSALDDSERLRRSVLHAATTGELVEQRMEDEPARSLLDQLGQRDATRAKNRIRKAAVT